MLDQYFGIKQLYEMTLKAKTPLQFGSRYLEVGEPVLYFKNISMASISEQQNIIAARGGWHNMPQVIWSDKSEMVFSLSEGVISSIEMGVLLSAKVFDETSQSVMYAPLKEGPMELQQLQFDGEMHHGFYLKHKPFIDKEHKVFIFKYQYEMAQQKMYGKLITREKGGITSYFLAIYEDKALQVPADTNKRYIVDYYYEYGEEALIYTMGQERFNGLFTLEGKFYAKDENEGHNYTNLIFMPKVRVVSSISLRLGERADPAVSAFSIIGLPETVGDKKNLIAEITRLNSDIESEL